MTRTMNIYADSCEKKIIIRHLIIRHYSLSNVLLQSKITKHLDILDWFVFLFRLLLGPLWFDHYSSREST